MDTEDGIKISEFPSSGVIHNSDVVTGLHAGENYNFTFSRIMAWFKDAVLDLFVPTTREINGQDLSSDIDLTAEDVGAAKPDIIASIETDTGHQAQKNYSVGEMMIVPGGILYVAIAPISIGDSLISDTNVKEVTVSDRIMEVEGEIPSSPEDIGAVGTTLIARVETSQTSEHYYLAGQYLILSGLLYRTSTIINIGDTIAAGSNVVLATVGGELESIKAIIPTQASDIGAVDSADVGVADGVASLDSNGILNSSQAPPASDINYDNTTSGLASTKVQGAIDEVYGAIPADASDVDYDNAISGLSAANVQAAVDEVASDVAGKQDEITALGILKGDGAGGVTAAVAGTDYQAPMTIDATPTASSTNPVQSGGVYTDVRTRVPVYGLGRNLLDNAYFVGGGSQLGDGVFPINQRGQTSYSGTGYGIDRWKQARSEIQQVVMSDCLRLNAVSVVSSGNLIYCYFYCPKLPAGTYTLSFLVKEATGSGGWYYSSDGSSGYGNVGNVRLLPGLVTKTFTATGNETNQSFYLWHQNALAVGDHLDIIAAMLEGGSEQTLCHNEGTAEAPVWVLNKIPDYGEELRKCQRYLCVLNANGAKYGAVGSGVAYSSTQVECLGFLPVSMRPTSNPSFSFTGSWQVSDGISGGQSLSVTSISVNLTAYYSGNSIVLAAKVSGATAGKFYILRAANDANARIFISAEP